MKKIILILVLSIFILGFMLPANYFISNLISLPISPPLGAYIEVPPIIISNNQVVVTSANSYQCTIDPEEIISGLVVDYTQITTRNLTGNQVWSRNYNGVYSAHPFPGGDILLLSHGENKNSILGDICYQNTVNTDVLCSECYSGLHNGVYSDCWQAYNGFVNLSVLTATQTIEYGPVVWPVSGYLSGTTKSSYGLRHPHGIISNGYAYVFYRDQSFTGGGTKVARAPATSYAPGNWQTYCNGQWVNSLPAGFNKENIANFYNVSGGCASSILPTTNNQVSFAVAEYEAGFLGIEEYIGATEWGLNLWQSDNLVDWVFVQNILTETGNWGAGTLHYPIFLASDLSSNYEVSSNEFYIIGTKDGSVRTIYLSGVNKTFLPIIINE